jgi:hypothetical protein
MLIGRAGKIRNRESKNSNKSFWSFTHESRGKHALSAGLVSYLFFPTNGARSFTVGLEYVLVLG